MSGIVYEFEGFRLDTARRTLTDRHGRAITLPSRALDALLLLVERRGLVLDRATLVGSLWPDTIVSQNSLDQLMSQLRRAFANGKEKRSVIRTERGRGFRFDAPLRSIRLVRLARTARSRRPPTHSPDFARALELCVQARALSTRPSSDNLRAAFQLAARALELAPALAQARSLVALLRTVFVAFDEPMPKAFELAEREARQALNADPSLPLGHQALANVLAARGAWREAEAHYDAACRFEKEPDARVTRIWQLVQSVGHLRRSLRLAAEIDTLAPSQPLGAVAAAQACCLLGLDRDASEHADTAASLGWPLHHPVACDLRAQLELRSGRFHEAAEWMTRGMGTRWRAAEARR